MYDLCVPAIEALAEETVEAYLGRIFFGPLGMTATSFRGEGGEDAAEGHVRGDGAESGGDLAPKPLVIHYGADFGLRSLENPIAWKGSAGLVSCAEDMVCFTIWVDGTRLRTGKMAGVPAYRPLLLSHRQASDQRWRSRSTRQLYHRQARGVWDGTFQWVLSRSRLC